MVDSGAFSAWTKNDEVDIDEYTNFCMERIDDIEYVVNLDVIPGKFGQKKIPKEEIERSAGLGWKNMKKMLKEGIPKEKLIHVFHQNEDMSWLIAMVNELEYIGLSPANDRTTQEKTWWLDECMSYVTNSKGKPILKLHGFAVTSIKLLKRYPWYSCDSATWVLNSGYGKILVPFREGRKWVWDKKREIIVSHQSEKAGVDYHAKNFHSCSGELRDTILAYIESEGFVLGASEIRWEEANYELKENERWFGEDNKKGKRQVETMKSDGICNNYRMRLELNARYFEELERTITKGEGSRKLSIRKGMGL